MISLLIVDDHPHQVDSIAHVVGEAGFPFLGEVRKAYSAQEALEQFDRNPVDIVITDIRMPEMSGIELIGELRSRSRQVKCVLLSGYAEFEYAQKAMELHASKYLMKPVQDEELLETLGTLSRDILEQRSSETIHQRAMQAVREHTPLAKERLLRDLVRGKGGASRELRRMLEMLELPFAPGDKVWFFAVQVEDDLSGYDSHDRELILYGAANIGSELLADCFEVWHAAMEGGDLVFVLKPKARAEKQPLERLERRAKEMQRSVYRYLKLMLSVGIVNGPVGFPGELEEAYGKSQRLFRNREANAAGLFATISELPQPKPAGSLESLYQAPALTALLEMEAWKEAHGRLTAVFAELEQKWGDSPEYAQEAFFVIAGSFQFVSHKRGRQLQDTLGALYREMREKHESWDLRAFRDWTFASLERIAGEGEPAYRNAGLTLAVRTRQYIEAHLDEELSLPMIADQLGFHPAYLSKVFRTETGQTLSDYLTKRRMERAAELLRSTDGKIYEIAEQAGYQTPHYFIKLFKNYYGLTPQQYRNRGLGPK